ncbi:MAG: choice-of-anchor J domain-containing protein [Prevotella sp.]|nr:choice-of-anchor J domain-containing protein [Prevotella sp.]
MRQLTLYLSLLLLPAMAIAQSRSTHLTIQVSSVDGDNLNGQSITLMQTDYQVSYGQLTLNAEGQHSLNVYPGNHNLSIRRDGFNPLSYDFTVGENEAEKTVAVTLTEQTRAPFALVSKLDHNVFDGTNSIELTWNTEAPAFFDDFERYTPFAIQFGEWTGIDADQEAAAPLIGSYPNRGVMQYAQIINPLKVEPTWWYDYPILRPYSGQQYAGFTRTNSGNPNDDWLISPVITVGTDNVLQFMAKAADRFPERFMVYATTQTDAPVQSDFVRLDPGNYETADYRGWQQYSYDLADYAGQQIKFAIRYISDYNQYGSFMLMLDDVYVGQAVNSPKAAKALRAPKSPANPNELFRIYLDGEPQGTTPDYHYTLSNIAPGNHTVGVQAVYLQEESDVTTIQVDVPGTGYARVTFNVSANSLLSPDGQQLSITHVETSESYEITIADGQAIFGSLPIGQYVVNIAEGAFDEYQQAITVEDDTTVDILLADHIITPYNITVTVTAPDDSPSGEALYTLRWNQQLLFSDSFEEYDDFATGTFGQWKTIDADQQPVYPIALNSIDNIVSFPGSGTAGQPTAIAPMVFNPWHTTPAMLPTDAAIKAPTGDKTVIFFSAQQARNDKWLISPLFDIHDDYALNVTAKGYSGMYPESLEFCVATEGDQPADFTAITQVEQLSSDQWTIYQTDLADYAGQSVRLAIHYTSYDAFLAQVDDFTVGPADGRGEIIDYGNIVRFDIRVDGEQVGESTHPEFTLPPLSEGTHVVSIKAVYQSGESDWAEYTIDVTTGIARVSADNQETTQTGSAVYTLSGQKVGTHTAQLPAGVYLLKQNGQTIKFRR